MKRSLSAFLARACLVLPWLVAVGIAAAQAPAAPQEFGPEALEQILLLQLKKSHPAPHQRKIDSRLRRMLDVTSPSPKYPGLASIQRPMPQADGTIALDIDTFSGDDVKAVTCAVEAAGA